MKTQFNSLKIKMQMNNFDQVLINDSEESTEDITGNDRVTLTQNSNEIDLKNLTGWHSS